jgi:Ca2+/H+ antiporter
MTEIARQTHVGAAWLFAIGVLVQGYFAGAALGQLGGSGDFSMHVAVGYTLGIVALAVPLLALAGRFPRAQVGWSALLLILYVVQTSLPYLRTDTPAIAALHPVNAMVLLVLAVVVAVRGRRLLRSTT